MAKLLAIVLGIHLNFRPPGMSPGKYLWRCFLLLVLYPHRPLCHRDLGCTLLCRRNMKLAEWEEKDNKEAFPKARLI